MASLSLPFLLLLLLLPCFSIYIPRTQQDPNRIGQGGGGESIHEGLRVVTAVFLSLLLLPNHKRWHAKMEARLERLRVAHTFFCTLGADLHAQSVLINKNFRIGAQSEVY